MKNTWKAIHGNNIDHPNVRTHVKNKQRYLYEANYIVSIGKYTGHGVSPVFFLLLQWRVSMVSTGIWSQTIYTVKLLLTVNEKVSPVNITYIGCSIIALDQAIASLIS